MQVSFASEMSELSESEVAEMSYTRLQKMHIAYSEFFMRHELDLAQGKAPTPKSTPTTFHNFWQDLLISHAYAFAPDGTLCFFGGWPSKMTNSSCRPPWTHKNDSSVRELGSYAKACGSPTLFRCNPVLFGKNSDGDGICIDNGGSYSNLTERCERETRAQRPKVIEEWQKDPSQLAKLSQEIKKFCDSYQKYDACDDLNKIVREITGTNLGNYSGEGFRQESTGGPRVQERNRNVAAEGDALSPNARRSPDQGVGQEILTRCAKLLQGNTSRMFSLPASPCVRNEVMRDLANVNDIARVAQTVNVAEAVAQINARAVEQNMIALMINDIRFGQPARDYSNKNLAFQNLTQPYPHLRTDPRYREAFERAYGEVDKEVKAGRAFPIELESTRVQFDNLAGSVNRACAQVRQAYKQRFGDAGLLQRYITARSDHQEFFQQQQAVIMRELNGLMQESMVGHLLSTSSFRRNIVDPREDYVESCARSEAFQVVKSPISSANIRAGHNDVKAMIAANMEKLSLREFDLNTGSASKASGHLRDLLTQDATLVRSTLSKLRTQDQKALGYAMCAEKQNIQRTDRLLSFGDTMAGAVGIAGGIIAMTGIGAPIGGALIGASAVWGAGRAASMGVGAYQGQRAADQSLAIRRQTLEEYFHQSQEMSQQKKNAIITGGLAALAGVPAVKILTAPRAATTTSSTALSIRSSGNVSVRTSPTPSTTPSTSTALTRQPSGTVSRSSGTGTARPTSAQAAGLDDALRARPFATLSSQQKQLVRQEVSQIIGSSGAKLPSSVVNQPDIARMSLDQARQKLMQMTNSPDARTAYRKISGAIHPDKHASRPQALKDLVNDEMSLINQLKERIFSLNNGAW